MSGHVRRRVVGSACMAPADVNSAFERVGLGLAPVRCSSAGADGVPPCRRATEVAHLVGIHVMRCSLHVEQLVVAHEEEQLAAGRGRLIA